MRFTLGEISPRYNEIAWLRLLMKFRHHLFKQVRHEFFGIKRIESTVLVGHDLNIGVHIMAKFMATAAQNSIDFSHGFSLNQFSRTSNARGSLILPCTAEQATVAGLAR